MAKDAGLFDEELMDHIVTQEDLDENSDLVDEGVKVGDVIQIPKDDSDDAPKTPTGQVEVEDEEEVVLDSRIPEWAQAKGVKVKKKDVASFFPKQPDKPLNREIKNEEWAQA